MNFDETTTKPGRHVWFPGKWVLPLCGDSLVMGRGHGGYDLANFKSLVVLL